MGNISIMDLISSRINGTIRKSEITPPPTFENIFPTSEQILNDSRTDEPPPPKQPRIEIQSANLNNIQPKKENRKYLYGNYDRYYGYRNPKSITDPRLETFRQHSQLFAGKDVLDVGCNTGTLTIAVARDLNAKSVTGIDIDRSLINRALHFISVERRSVSVVTVAEQVKTYPHNVIFKHGNYIVSDEKLLELEQPHFDTILCLSVTKWMQLNAGDAGLMIAFRRMFRSLRPGGSLVLEAQDWKSYKRRKKLTDKIHENFKNIKLMPSKFEETLLGEKIGFERCYEINLKVTNKSQGFRRPIKVSVVYNLFLIFSVFE